MTRSMVEIFEDYVNKKMNGKKYLLGHNRDGTRFYLVYDFVTVVDRPVDDEWRVSTVWFYVEREDGKKFFRVFNQPKIRVIFNECFDYKLMTKLINRLGLVKTYFNKVCELASADIRKCESHFSRLLTIM